jgi:hypothetical protein
VFYLFEAAFRLSTQRAGQPLAGPTLEDPREKGESGDESVEDLPLTAADVRLLMGLGDPEEEDLLLGGNSETGPRISVVDLDESTGIGKLEVDGRLREVVSLPEYVSRFPLMDAERVAQGLRRIRLNGTIVRCGSRKVDSVYLKPHADEAIRAIYRKKVHLDERGVGVWVDAGELEEIARTGRLQGVEVVELGAYFQSKGNREGLLARFRKSLLRSVLLGDVEVRDAAQKRLSVALFHKDEVDEWLEEIWGEPLVSEPKTTSFESKLKFEGESGDSTLFAMVTIGEEGIRLSLMPSKGQSASKVLEALAWIGQRIGSLGREDLEMLEKGLRRYEDALYNCQGSVRFSPQFIDDKIAPAIEGLNEEIEDRLMRLAA